MGNYEMAFVAMGINPFGGLFFAIPLAMYKLHYPLWLTLTFSVALAYVQVLVVDLGFNRLSRWKAFIRFVESKRSDKLEAHLASKSAALWITLLSPWIGPWLVMALSRLSGVGLRKVGLPLLGGLTYVSVLIAVLCSVAPEWLPEQARSYLE